MRERIIIVFIAIAIGLLITTLVFFLYQQTKSIPQAATVSTNDGNATPTPASSVFLQVDSPADESLSDKRSIQVKGTTNPGNIIVVSTNQEDIATEPTNDGEFTVSIDIDAGTNKIITRAISPDGDEAQDVRVVTYSTEEF